MTQQHIPTQKVLKYTPRGPNPSNTFRDFAFERKLSETRVFWGTDSIPLHVNTSFLPLQSSSSRYFKFLLPGPNIAIKIPTNAISSIATVTNTATCKRDSMQCRVLLPPRCPDSECFSDNSKRPSQTSLWCWTCFKSVLDLCKTPDFKQKRFENWVRITRT